MSIKILAKKYRRIRSDMQPVFNQDILFLSNTNAAYAKNSLEALEIMADKGSLVICEMVFAELASQFPSLERLKTFLNETDITLVSSTDQALYESSLAWKKYLEDRKRKQKCPHCKKIITGRNHIISDFIIGGHAQKCADQLITRDRGFNRT